MQRSYSVYGRLGATAGEARVQYLRFSRFGHLWARRSASPARMAQVCKRAYFSSLPELNECGKRV